MKQLLFYLLLIFIPLQYSYCQDTIYLHNGTQLNVKVEKVGIYTVEYTKQSNPDGPMYEILKNDIKIIRYSNSTEDVFDIKMVDEYKDSETDHFTDLRDGNIYETIKIGDQIWMRENLRYIDSNGMCFTDSDNNCDECGYYYKFGNALIACPKGWHLPSDDEWIELEMEVGMSEAKAHKEGWRGTHPGQSQSLRVKGSSGLDLHLCGYGVRALIGRKIIVSYSGKHGYYWTSTEYSFIGGSAYARHFTGRASIERLSEFTSSFFPIRCVKDSK